MDSISFHDGGFFMWPMALSAIVAFGAAAAQLTQFRDRKSLTAVYSGAVVALLLITALATIEGARAMLEAHATAPPDGKTRMLLRSMWWGIATPAVFGLIFGVPAGLLATVAAIVSNRDAQDSC